MNVIKESDFRKEIKAKPSKGYLFFGEEDYMKSFALKLAVDVISPDPSFSFFNEVRFDALSYSPDALLDALMPLPMMADRKVIIVSGVDFNAMKSHEVDALCAVLDQLDEYDYNTVIINAASDRLDVGVSLKRPSSLLKKLGERLTLVNFEKNTPARLVSWLQKHFEHHGVVASPAVCALVIERCGRDMFNLASETEKVSFYVRSQNRSEALREDVLFVATPAAEYDAFAFANAIGARRKEEALDILRELKMRRMDPILIMSEITKTACDMLAVALLRTDGLTAGEMAGILKIHDYRISLLLKNNPKEQICRNMVARCREADLELKMSRDGYAVIEKLICTI